MARNRNVWYSVPWDLEKDANPERFECKLTFDVSDEESRDLLARECADDYHNNHDGWESAWPLVLILYASEEGPEIARFNVDRDMEPVFYARRC